MSRVNDPADPRRCKWTFPHEQCWNVAASPSDYCEAHGGAQAAREESHRLYHLTEARYRQRLAQLTEHDQIQSLNEVIALARRLVEKRFNLIKTDADFEEAIGPINMLQLTVERIVKSAHSIEKSLDALLSKSTVYQLGQLIIQIASDELAGIEDYSGILGKITDRTVAAIATATNAEKAPTSLTAQIRRALPDANQTVFQIEDVEDKIRIAELSRSERLKSLNEDIKLCSLMIEKRWNLVKCDADLIQAIPALNNQLRTLEKLIKSAHQIEQSLGYLLSESSLNRLGDAVSTILLEELNHIEGFELYIDSIMDRIAATLSAQKQLPAPTPKRLTNHTLADSIDEPTP